MESIGEVLADIDGTAEEVIQTALSFMRRHLSMEVAYISEFVDEHSVFRAVDAPGLEATIRPGDCHNIDELYCAHVLAGRLPRLIPDTSAFPLTATMPITRAIPIGSHISVPITRDDGSIYGMFCCLSTSPNPSLNDRDLEVMEIFASFSAERLNRKLRSREQTNAILKDVQAIIESQAYDISYQPIVELDSRRLAGFEALCRFRFGRDRTPDNWFAEAEMVGLGPDLELAVMERALTALPRIPDGRFLSLNVTPTTVSQGCLDLVLEGQPIDRIVIEMTERISVEQYGCVMDEVQKWRQRGLRFAVDDAGAGFFCLQHLVRLAPDILKLDRSLVSDIDRDAGKRSFVAAMVHFSNETRSHLIAEGVETEAEAAALRQLGVGQGQGWLFGHPRDLASGLAAHLASEAEAGMSPN